MVVTDDFVFIHTFRMGGTSCINELDGKMIGYHRPHSLLPSEYSHLPVIGTVRNPLDWYISVYTHCLNIVYPMRTSTFLNFLLDFKQYDFKETIKRLIDTSWMTSTDKEKALKHFPQSYNWDAVRLDNLRKDEFQSYLDGDVGFLSWIFNYMYSKDGSTDKVKLCKLESLGKDWKKITGKEVSFKWLNSYTDSVDYISQYDDEVINLIKEKDKDYIARFYSQGIIIGEPV